MQMEPDAVVQVLLRRRLRVTGFAAAVLRDVDAADDIFQQVVLSALEARSQFRDADHVLAWALKAARHRAIDLARKRHLRSLPDEVLDAFESRWADPAGAPLSDRGEALNRCMGRLAEPAREILRLKYADGLTAEAIAARFRRSVNGIYQTLSRIHRSLRACVEKELVGISNPIREVPT